MRFHKNSEYTRPTGAYPLRDFHEICSICTSFQSALTGKIWMDLLNGLHSYGGFKLRVGFPLKFSVPPSGETMHQTPKSLEVQEHARDPLSPCQVSWGSDFTRLRRQGGQKH